MKRKSTRLNIERLEDRIVPSSPGDIDWLHQFGSEFTGSGQGLDPARAVAADGSVYVAGDLPHVLPGQISAGQTDAYVRKYDAAGNELWTRQFGTAGFEEVDAIAVDASGVYVSARSTVAGAFLRKYDAAGNELWTRQLDLFAQAIAVDASGIYAVATIPAAEVTVTDATDVYVRKYDLAANELWTRYFGTDHDDFATSVAVDASGVYVAGYTHGTLPGQTNTIVGDDAFVRKYDAVGNELWTHQFGTVRADDRAVGVAADSSGIYVAGITSGTLPGQDAGLGICFVRKYDPAGTEIWTRQFGAAARAFPSSITVGPSGVYVAGDTEGGAFPGQTNAGGHSDVFVRKYDAAGTELWTRQFGSADDDHAAGVAVDASGVYVVGSADGDLPGEDGNGTFSRSSFVHKYDDAGNDLWTHQFGPATDEPIDAARAVAADGNIYVAGDVGGVLPGQTSAFFAGDAFVRKYDAAGSELWTRQFGTNGFSQVLAVAADASGVYVVGYTDGTFPGQTSAGGPDVFLRKYDTAGNELWTRQFGSSGTDWANGIAVTAAGVYVTGSTTGTLPGQTAGGDQDAFVRAYDPSGNELWSRQFGSSGWDQATGAAADASGVYVSGFTAGVFTGQAGAGEQDAFVRKYDAAGNMVWTRQFGTGSADQASGIAADNSGVYVAGRTAGTLPGQTGAGLTDAFVRRYDANGNVIWTRQFGSAGTDLALGVAVDRSGIFVTGSTEGALPGQTSAGNTDAFVRKYDTDANLLWTGQFGSAGADAALGVAVSTGGLFVVGTTTGEFPGQTSAGGQDAFVAKIVDNGTFTSLSSSDSAPVFGQSITFTATVAVTSGGAGIPGGTVQFRVDGSDFGSPVALVNGTASINTDGLSPGPHTITAYYSGDDFFEASTSDALNQAVNPATTATAAYVSAPTPLLGVDSLTVSAVVSVVAPGSGNPTGTVAFYDGASALGTANLVNGAASLVLGNTALAARSHTIRAVYSGDVNFQSSESTASVNVLAPSTLQGLVYLDANNNGQVDLGEPGIPGGAITLTGIDDLGQTVGRATQTDINGIYVLANLRPSDGVGYTITETQPAGYPEGLDTLGTVNGVPTGSSSSTDTFSGIVIAQGGSRAENYNFGERPAANGGGVQAGQTAGIGYWQNRNGQNLIRALNGGSSATQLGRWLATTFPNMYATLDGKTNAQVADFYKTLFARTAQTAPAGPPKVDAQVLATAFAVYVTNQTLAGTTAVAYGFQVDATGLGTRTFNVGANGAAFGAANNANVSVMDLLLAVNTRAHKGLLYDLNGNGQIDSSEASYRTMANDVFAALNEAGDAPR